MYDGPEQAFDAREVLLCLKGLPPRERFALVAHCLQGFSQEEVADVMKVKRGAVAAHISHVRSSSLRRWASARQSAAAPRALWGRPGRAAASRSARQLTR